MTTFRTAAAAGIAACGMAMLLGAAPAGTAGQGAAAADATGPGVAGTGVFTSFVENMDRSLAFYHEAFGLEVPAMPASGSRPYNNPNPRLFAMFDIPGARERHQSARLPGGPVTVELMEIQDVEHRTIPLRVQDPGAATLVLLVRDLRALLPRLRQAQGTIVTPGGQPVPLGDGTLAILARDVDGRFIELRQPAAPQAGAGGDAGLLDMRLSIAVGDLEQTVRAYRDVLGFAVEGQTPFAADGPTRALTGLGTAEVRRARVRAPGSPLWIEFVEYRGVERTPHRMRIQDRGAARLQLRARQVDALVAAMASHGFRVISEGGGPVPIPPNLKGALVADPNGFFLTPFEACESCAPRRPSQ